MSEINDIKKQPTNSSDDNSNGNNNVRSTNVTSGSTRLEKRPKPDSKNNKKTRKVKPSVLIAAGAVVLVAVVCAIFFLPNGNKEHEEVSMNSSKAAEIDPTNYNMSDEEKKMYKDKVIELLGDNAEANMEKVYSYFTNEINKQLGSGNTDQACKILWIEHDTFMENAMPESALQALLRMDDTKLEKYQKIYLYRAIVTASVTTNNKEVEDKYTALVIELDPPAAPVSETPAPEGQSQEQPQEQPQGQ